MKAISINSEFIINFCLPIDETIKGIISMPAAAPIVLVSVKDFYGLRSYRLACAVIVSVINNRDLEYRSEGIWKELNRYVRGRRKELAKDEKSAGKHTAVNAGMYSS